MKSCFTKNVILLWVIVNFFPLSCGKGCTNVQKEALLQIKNSTNGLAFKKWDGRDCCEAEEIRCNDAGGGVSAIYSWEMWASPSIWYPNVTLFTLFDELEALTLSGAQIGGGLEPFCELKKLTYLERMDLGNNTLEGNIPRCLGMFENLQEIVLVSNRLTGNVPSSIFSNHSKIMVFDVSRNQLEGVLSFSMFANASSLYYLSLSNNENLEVETESSSWVPSFQLDTLDLAHCNLNQKYGHVFPSFISTQISLSLLDLSSTSIEISIPCWLLFNTNIAYLFLDSNKISGSFLDCVLNRISALQLLVMSHNNIIGPLPENIGNILLWVRYVDMSSNALEGTIPWSFGNLSLEMVDLSNNMLSGTIPQSLTKGGIPLEYLNLSNNKLQGEMLPRDSNMTKLEYLKLSGNYIDGIISPTILNSPNLVVLDVQNNQLSGTIPRWLYDHTHLVAILLSGNHLEGHLLQEMCQMKNVQIFSISNNHISGNIPSCLDNVKSWKEPPKSIYSKYDIFQGDLFFRMALEQGISLFDVRMSLQVKKREVTFEGIPLSLMTAIDLSSNQLTGSIPFEIGKLSQLLSLNFSSNFLIGPIPNSFRNLVSVESLDLSHNKLSGKIPNELVGLSFLAIFSVAYNNLSGRIPFEGQFLTFEMQYFDSNPELCGNPLPRNCSTTIGLELENKGQSNDGKEETKIIDDPIFYAFVAISYVIGFWVFWGILIINKNWRQIYFRIIEKYIDRLLF